MIAFYHEKDLDMLKLGCTLPNPANICLYKSTDTNFYLLTEADEDLLEKIQKKFVGGPSIVFTRKAVVDKTFLRKSTNICKSIVGIDAIQLYPYSMCQPKPIDLSTRRDLNPETKIFTLRQNKTRSFESMVKFTFQRTRPDCMIESFYKTGRQKKIDCVSVDGFCSHCTTVFEAMGCFQDFGPWQEVHPSLSLRRIFNVVLRKERSMNWDEAIYEKKTTLLLKCRSVKEGDCTRQAVMSKNISENTCLTDVHLQLTNY